MEKNRALKNAIELTNTLLASVDYKGAPSRETGDAIADCIETLATRLEKMGYED